MKVAILAVALFPAAATGNLFAQSKNKDNTSLADISLTSYVELVKKAIGTKSNIILVGPRLNNRRVWATAHS